MIQKHKYALVTGASSGIGWHISKELAASGYSIIAVSNQQEQLGLLKKELESIYSITVFIIHTNLARASAAMEVFDQCDVNHLEVEVLVNNAGMLIMEEALKVDHAKADSIIHLHVTTVALLCQLFAKKMTVRKSGYILNVSSIAAVMPYPIISLYGPTKTFIRSFTRALRTEVKFDGIQVTCLLPGATATALYDSHTVNVPLVMKLGVMKNPESVARAGVRALFAGRAECIPGTMNKLVVKLLPLIPNAVIVWIYKMRNRK